MTRPLAASELSVFNLIEPTDAAEHNDAVTVIPTRTTLSADEDGELERALLGQGMARHPLFTIRPLSQTFAKIMLGDNPLPMEIRQMIWDFLSIKHRIAFKGTCQEAYFLGNKLDSIILVRNAPMLGAILDKMLNEKRVPLTLTLEIASEQLSEHARLDRFGQLVVLQRNGISTGFDRLRTSNPVISLTHFAKLTAPEFQSIQELSLNGCVFVGSTSHDKSAVEIICDIAPESVSLSKLDWLRVEDLESMYAAGTRKFTLQGNKLVTPDQCAELMSRDGINIVFDIADYGRVAHDEQTEPPMSRRERDMLLQSYINAYELI